MATTFIEEKEIKGGVLRCIDQATGDIARTTSGWIEDEKYGWYATQQEANWSAEFDSAVTRTGKFTVKLSTTDISGKIRVADTQQSSGVNLNLARDFARVKPVKPNTPYLLECYVKTNNAATNSVYVGSVSYTSTGVAITTNATNKLSGTNDWTKLTKSFTTGDTTTFVSLRLFNDVAGNISDAWFDVNSMTLEEVATINNPSASPVKLYPKVTAVSSTDNIDQTSNTGGANIYTLTTTIDEAKKQLFLPTKNKNVGIQIYPVSKGTGDWTLTVHNSSNTVIGTPRTITNANITEGAYQSFLNSFNWTTGTYHFHVTSTVADGTLKTNGNEDSTKTAYYTLYSKNTTNFTVRTDTETLTLSTNPEGWEDGLVRDTYGINALTPLTLAPGDNTVYISSNGSDLADGTVDPSLQFIFSGRLKSGGSGSGRKDGGYSRMGDKRIRSKRGTNYGALGQF